MTQTYGVEENSDPLQPVVASQPRPAPFRSILFPGEETSEEIESWHEPECFADLNLDQIVQTVTAGRREYNLQPFFYMPARTVETVRYRQEVFRDLEKKEMICCIRSFAKAMQKVRNDLTGLEKLFYQRQKQRCFLDAVDGYCGTLCRLAQVLTLMDLHSEGLRAFRDHLTGYCKSAEFRVLEAVTRKILFDLGGIVYSLHIAGKRVTVSRYSSQPDYGADVLQTFEKFRQAEPKEYRFRFRGTLDMNHVEAAILDRVAQLYPEIFSSLGGFCSEYKNFLNPIVARFDREIQFYVAWIEHMQPLLRAGLPFCYPELSQDSKEVRGMEVYDLALADRLVRERAPVVTNAFSICGRERIMVVSGPNQGGKTTFARTFGQLHYLGALGCPVTAKEAKLFLFDRLFTHFEREENLSTLRGKLEDELIRIRRILDHATADSILVMNESFLSTTLDDAVFLSRQIMQQVIDLDVLCVSVTFLDELATMSPTTVSMVSTVDPADPARRTFKVIRKPADGLAYAMAIADKYGVTHDAVKGRIFRNAGRNAG
jgi:hypothetical protein